MLRYFLHVTDGNRVYRDSRAASRSGNFTPLALRDARDLMCQNAEDVQDPADWEIQVCDQTGQQLLAVPFAEAVRGSAPAKRQ